MSVPTAPVLVRLACSSDLVALAALEAEVYRPDERWTLADYDDLFTAPGACFVVASTPDDPVVAYAVAAPSDDEPSCGPTAVHVVALTVAPSHRRTGLARRLLAELLDRTSPGPHVLEVAVDNAAAITLYTSAGFVVTHRLADHYGPGRDAYAMARPAAR